MLDLSFNFFIINKLFFVVLILYLFLKYLIPQVLTSFY